MIRTTVSLDDNLYKEARKRAIDKRVAFTDVVNDALSQYLNTETLEKNDEENSFFKAIGILSDEEAKRMLKMVKDGRNDGSRKKKYLAKW